ncbi:MAG: energy transducer TonB [Rhodothermales bacterium]
MPALSLVHRSGVPQKAPGLDVRKNHRIKLEVGCIIALLGLIGLFRVPLQFSTESEEIVLEQEMVQMEEIVQTKQIVKPPPPPRPPTPVVVPDDAIIEDVELELDAALDIGVPLETLPPPPLPPEEEAEALEEEDEIFMAVEEMPELIGGIASIQKDLQYPDVARLAGIQGRVYVQFVVDEQGNAIDPVVVRGIGGGCDEEAIRVVKLAKFKPGRQRGRPVKVRYAIPVNFRLK